MFDILKNEAKRKAIDAINDITSPDKLALSVAKTGLPLTPDEKAATALWFSNYFRSILLPPFSS